MSREKSNDFKRKGAVPVTEQPKSRAATRKKRGDRRVEKPSFLAKWERVIKAIPAASCPDERGTKEEMREGSVQEER